MEYTVIGVIGLGVTVYLCANLLGFYMMLSKVIAIILMFFWSFLARRFILYRKRANQ